MVNVVETTVSHLIEFRKHVRPQDLEEIKAASRQDFDKLLLANFADCKTLIDADTKEVLGIGSIELYNKARFIWLITTAKIETRKIEFLKFSKIFLKELLKEIPLLFCVPFLNNKLHINWLEWLGAKQVNKEQEFGLYVFERGD